MKNNAFYSMILSILTFSLLTAPVQAGGLSMVNYGEVLVENLSIGGVYSMTQVVNLPLLVSNQSDAPIKVKLSVIKPVGQKVKKGFEPIPDPSWVKIGESMVDIAANGTYSTDVIISIPDRKEYLSKKYHVNIQAQIIPAKTSMVNVALAVEGRLLFTVAPVKQAMASTKAINARLDFNFVPAFIKMSDIPLGEKVPVITPEKVPVQIKNLGKERLMLILSSPNIDQTIATLEPGYEAAPNQDFLSFATDELTVGASTSAPLQVFIEIPAKPEYQGKSYEFIVSASTSGATAGSRYLRVLVSTKK